MSCPWPLTEADVDLEAALDIALDYLEGTGQIHPFFETLQVCTTAITEAWRRGVRHRIRLANCAIKAIEYERTAPEADNRNLVPLQHCPKTAVRLRAIRTPHPIRRGTFARGINYVSTIEMFVELLIQGGIEM